jgi:hypothetical protein
VNWTPDRLDRLERAITERSRVQLSRRGTEFVIVPLSLRTDIGSEVLTATHPNTGDRIEFRLDEVDYFTVLS